VWLELKVFHRRSLWQWREKTECAAFGIAQDGLAGQLVKLLAKQWFDYDLVPARQPQAI
jgi:hypothetical protein